MKQTGHESLGLTRNIIHQTTAMIGGATDVSVTLASYTVSVQ